MYGDVLLRQICTTTKVVADISQFCFDLSVTEIRNQTSIPFLLCDDGFTSRKQFWLVVTVDRKPAQECPQWPHAAAKEDAGQGEEAIDIVDVTSDDKTFNLTWSYDNTLVLDRYRLVNVTDIVVKVITDSIMVSTGNSSVLISFRVKNVNAECDSIAATENYSPLLVAFDDSEFRFEEVFSSAVAEPDEQRANKSQFIRDSTKIREKRETGRRCQLRNWYVDFSELGLDHLIYTPSGYHANFCDGSCRFEFLLVNLFSIEPVENNHAMLRRFYRQYVNHEQQNVVIPPHVTCAPTSLKSLTMLYRDAVHSYYVLNSVPNMIVTDCGCI